MGRMKKIAVALLAVVAIPTMTWAATLGGYYYAVQYDYREFFWISDGKTFQVILAGNPFPTMSYDDAARQLLPQMQIAKPRPNLTFTYAQPPEPPHPWYRLYLIADPANDLEAYGVCAYGNPRFRPSTPGRMYVFAIYCRNEIALSQTTAWTNAAGPNDPAVQQLFRQLFMVIFSDSPTLPPRGSNRRTGP
jgi:hypothetical protein